MNSSLKKYFTFCQEGSCPKYQISKYFPTEVFIYVLTYPSLKSDQQRTYLPNMKPICDRNRLTCTMVLTTNLTCMLKYCTNIVAMATGYFKQYFCCKVVGKVLELISQRCYEKLYSCEQ